MPSIQRCPSRRLRSLYRLLVAGVVLTSAFAGAGCGHLELARAVSRAIANAVEPAAPPIPPLPPLANGPGLVVCEPTATGGNGALTHFGAGCGRWLEFELAGQPSLGKSPDWGSIQRALDELGRSDLRLTTADALKLQPMLGFTHAAVGTITGNSTHCTLTYTLLEFPGGRAAGTPVVLEGTEQQIITGLPSAAQKLGGLLNVSGAALPSSVGMNADDLSLIGSVMWLTPRNIVSLREGVMPPLSSDDSAKLSHLSAQAPLATMLLLQHLTGGPAGTRILAKRMMGQSPDNCLALDQIGWSDPSYLLSIRDQFDQRMKQHPDNFLLTRAAVAIERRGGNLTAEVQAGEQEVRCAPENPDAWLTLAWALRESGDSLRQGRTAGMLSEDEWASLRKIYAEWLHATQRATELDPNYGKAWLRVSEAACFAGNDQLADAAFWKAARLYKKPEEVYDWGLQMYQPKWLDQPAKLTNVAHLIASNTSWTFEERVDMATALQDAGFDQLARGMASAAIPEAEKRVHSAPNKGFYHEWLAQAYHLAGRTHDAEQEYQISVKLLPRSADAHYLYGTFLDSKGDIKGAIAEYKEAVRLNPNSRMAAAALLHDLGPTSQF